MELQRGGAVVNQAGAVRSEMPDTDDSIHGEVPHSGPQETSSVRVTGQPDLPDGEYSFVELYCNEPGCDCRRVTILVLRPETGWSKVSATIGYGWEDLEFYRKWAGGSIDPVEIKGPHLDPLTRNQAFIRSAGYVCMLIQSPEYVERLKRHYEMFRDFVEQEHGRTSKAPGTHRSAVALQNAAACAGESVSA